MAINTKSLVGIAIHYGLKGPGIEFRWGESFRTCPDRPCGAPSLLYNGYGIIPGEQRPERGFNNPFPLASRLKEE
jgi:hypothetical protein